jgi:predicted naringenin-chalcone synthase
MSLAILGIGTAVPQNAIEAEEALAFAESIAVHAPEDELRLMRVLYKKSGVQRRHSVLLGPEGSPQRQTFFPVPNGKWRDGPGVQARMEQYESEAMPLARLAAQRALDSAGLLPQDVSHLVTVSCTGFAAPGVDIGLVRSLGLPPTTERVHVGFMGCHGALNGLRTARGIAAADPGACVLLTAVELCTLHFSYQSSPGQHVANSLFADGAAAVVGRNSTQFPWRVAASGSCLLPDSQDDMSWRISDHGFVMRLSAQVPVLIEQHVRSWLESWLGESGLSISDIGSWAVHPGGPKILHAVARGLDLPPYALDVSTAVLRTHGNMSSPTVLFVLERLREMDASLPCLMLGFGPGLTAEAILIR